MKDLPLFGETTSKCATLSPCETYRYRLVRLWRRDRPLLPFIMLNPSTADEREDDPTIRRCMGFAGRELFGGIVVGNLYALRSTDPSRLRQHPAPDGPDNGAYLTDIALTAAASGTPIVCAWGANAPAQGDAVKEMLARCGARLVCLGTTKEGHPRHPLYVPGSQPLVDFA